VRPSERIACLEGLGPRARSLATVAAIASSLLLAACGMSKSPSGTANPVTADLSRLHGGKGSFGCVFGDASSDPGHGYRFVRVKCPGGSQLGVVPVYGVVGVFRTLIGGVKPNERSCSYERIDYRCDEVIGAHFVVNMTGLTRQAVMTRMAAVLALVHDQLHLDTRSVSFVGPPGPT
jgi:hypothetical protein